MNSVDAELADLADKAEPTHPQRGFGVNAGAKSR